MWTVINENWEKTELNIITACFIFNCNQTSGFCCLLSEWFTKDTIRGI